MGFSNLALFCFLWLFIRLPDWAHSCFFKINFALYSHVKPHHLKRVQDRLKQHLYPSQAPTVYFNLYKNTLYTLRVQMGIKTYFLPSNFGSELTQDKPTIAFGLHIGAFELMHHALGQLGRPVYVAVHSHGTFDPLLQKLRKTPNVHFFDEANFAQTFRKIQKQNAILAVLIDQGKGRTTPVPFLNGTLDTHIRSLEACWNPKWNKMAFSICPNNDTYQVEYQCPAANTKLLPFLQEWSSSTMKQHGAQWVWHYPKGLSI